MATFTACDVNTETIEEIISFLKRTFLSSLCFNTNQFMTRMDINSIRKELLLKYSENLARYRSKNNFVVVSKLLRRTLKHNKRCYKKF